MDQGANSPWVTALDVALPAADPYRVAVPVLVKSGILDAIELFLVQHGQGKSKAEDPSRGLNERGIEEVTRIGAWAAPGKLPGMGIPEAELLRLWIL